MNEREKIKLLYVDDERVNLLAFKANFRRDYQVFTAESAAKGEELLDKHNINVVVADQRMPAMTGVQFFEKILPKHPDCIRILLTGFSDITAVIDAINKGKVYSYVTKPWNEDELRTTIAGANEAYQLQVRNRALENKYKQLFDLTSDAVLTLDAKARIIDANKSCVERFGYNVEELNTLDYSQLFENVGVVEEVMSHIKTNRGLNNFELTVKTRGGDSLPCYVSSSEIMLSDDMSVTYQLIIKDLS